MRPTPHLETFLGTFVVVLFGEVQQLSGRKMWHVRDVFKRCQHYDDDCLRCSQDQACLNVVKGDPFRHRKTGIAKEEEAYTMLN